MTDTDFDSFQREFQRLSGALERRPVSLEQLRTRAGAYFSVLRALPLDAVRARADGWLARESKFPTPAEWLHAPVKRRLQTDGEVLTDAQIEAYREAQQTAFQGEPCRCRECQSAGVSHRFARFVPDEDADGHIPSMRLGGPDGVIVYAGHWAHGGELQRWYAARDRFFAHKGTLTGPLAAVFRAIDRATRGKPEASVKPPAQGATA